MNYYSINFISHKADIDNKWSNVLRFDSTANFALGDVLNLKGQTNQENSEGMNRDYGTLKFLIIRREFRFSQAFENCRGSFDIFVEPYFED
jgi:hypothetical protein